MPDIVSCPACRAKNRLSPEPEAHVPVCGRCGAALPWLVEATDATFGEATRSSVPVLVDFWAPWCGPCRIVAPILEELASENAGKLKVVKLNTDENQKTAASYRVQGIPTFIVIQKGQQADRFQGALGKAQFKARLAPYL